jgi:hypothetical protein
MALLKTGLVDAFEVYSEMETDSEGRHAGKSGSLFPARLDHLASPGGASLEIAPKTPTLAPGEPVADHRFEKGAPYLFSSWAQHPHQKALVLPAEDVRAKLHQLCEGLEGRVI